MFETTRKPEQKPEPKNAANVRAVNTQGAKAHTGSPYQRPGQGFESGALKAMADPGSLVKALGHFAEKLPSGAGSALRAQAEGRSVSEQVSQMQGPVKMTAAQAVKVGQELTAERKPGEGTLASKTSKSEGSGFYSGFASVALTGITNNQSDATQMDQDVTGDQSPEGYAAYGNNPIQYGDTFQSYGKKTPDGPLDKLANMLGSAGQSIQNGFDKAGDKAASWLGHIPLIGGWLGNKVNQGLDAVGNKIGNTANSVANDVQKKDDAFTDNLDRLNDVAAVTQYATAADKAVKIEKGPDGKPNVNIDWATLEKTQISADLGVLGGKISYDNPKQVADNGCAAVFQDMKQKGLDPNNKDQFVSVTGHSGGGQSSFYTALKLASEGYKNVSVVGVDMAMTPHERAALEAMGVKVTNITSHNVGPDGKPQTSEVGQAVQFGMGGGKNHYDINVQRTLGADTFGRHSLNNDPAVLTMVRYSQYLDSVGQHGNYNDPNLYKDFMGATNGQGDAATIKDKNQAAQNYHASGPGMTPPTFIDQRGLPGPEANSTDPSKASNPIERIGTTLPILGDKVNGLIDGVGKGIGNKLDQAGDKTSGFLSGLFDKVGGAVGGAANKLIDGIGHGLHNGLDKAGDVAQSLLGGIPLIGGWLGQKANQGLDSLGERIDDKLDHVGDQAQDGIQKTTSGIGSKVGGAANSLLDGMGNGIANGFDKLGDWAGEKTDGLVGKLVGVLQGVGVDLSHIKGMEKYTKPSPEPSGEQGSKDSKDVKGTQDKSAKTDKTDKSGEFSAGLGKDVDELAKKSPTLQHKLTALQDDGWTIRYGTASKGTFADRGKKEIVIDSNSKGKPMDIVQSLAHESGHAGYTVDPYVGPSGKNKDEYVSANVTRNLKDEGEATITNLEIRAELMNAKAGDIGIAGAQGKKYEELFKKYPDPKDRDKLREEIGKVFAKGESPSVKKADGTPYGNYEEYYGQTYKDHWDKHVTPGKDGRAPLPEEHMEPHASEEQADEVQQQH